MKISGIYGIFNVETGRVYVGQGTNLKERRRSHFNLLKRGEHFNKHLQRSYDAHGRDCFLFKMLKDVPPSRRDLFYWEQYFVDHYRATSSVYNMTAPACNPRLGGTHSTEARLAISKAKKLYWTGARRAELSAAATLRMADPAVRKLYSDRLRGRARPQELVERMSTWKRLNQGKPVESIDPVTGIAVEYVCIADAARAHGVNSKAITTALDHPYYKSSGLWWRRLPSNPLPVGG